MSSVEQRAQWPHPVPARNVRAFHFVFLRHIVKLIALLAVIAGITFIWSPHQGVAVGLTKHMVTIDVPTAATPGVRFDWHFAITPGEMEGPMDLYAALILPDGVLRFLLPWRVTEVALPYLSNFEVRELKADLLPNFELPSGLPDGEYLFGVVLVVADQDPLNEANWGSNLAVATLQYAPLSPHQQAFVHKVGYPDGFLKTFDREEDGTLRVDESWLYLEDGMGEYFVHGVFVAEETMDSSKIAVAPTPYHPEDYPFDMTREAIEARHGEPLSVHEGVLTGHPFFDEFPANTYLIYEGLILALQEDTLVTVLGLK